MKKRLTLRIDEQSLTKIKHIAHHNGRSINAELIALIGENIDSFEQEHGKLEEKAHPDIPE
ncbi:MAG TPA: Arc family DNA-binding protein [Candidatus Faecivivens stercoravium]|uniref:Arc family DNA-binding protein n=1 Tax=Candidatus Faecivivens stercoravium TaxID=2840803 RepID=A0A9D1DVZ1_9FIRM|nr:Arc family DNA-binding protein [Candidatus Faecivivens stercoravium]